MRRQDEAERRNDFTDTVREFERWRAERRPGERIPEPLWAAAMALASEHGVARTAATLRLDYYSVKKRLAASDAAGAPAGPDGSRPRFVELPVAGAMRGITCTLEIESGAGGRSKLRIELGGIAPSDLDGVIRAARGQSA